MFIGIGHDNPHENNVKEDEVRFTAGVVLIKRDIGIEHVILSGSPMPDFTILENPITSVLLIIISMENGRKHLQFK